MHDARSIPSDARTSSEALRRHEDRHVVTSRAPASPNHARMTMSNAHGSSRTRIRIGSIWIDAITRQEALAALKALVTSRRGGTVFTPNVDHVLMAETNSAFQRAYADASIVL